ncbi:MAG: biopolymer transporter ExbD [Leptospiraceae bacterium]|nr:MAG: biopolymer transporter ExbD [Leptospiraceae bacterium]
MSLRKKLQVEEISAASMSDLAFLLLIFFMVASVFYVKEGLISSLPKKDAKPKLVLRKNIYKFEVNRNIYSISNIEIGKKSFDNFYDFRKFLISDILIENIEEKYAVLSAKNTNVQGMVSLISLVKEKGFKKISIQRNLK